MRVTIKKDINDMSLPELQDISDAIWSDIQDLKEELCVVDNEILKRQREEEDEE